MERELWLVLYRIARECDPRPWWAVTQFFRLGDRGSVPLGSDPRSTDVLGLQPSELA